MARTHTFRGSASAGYGYFAYIDDGQLVIGEDWGREGGIIFRGDYEAAVKQGHMDTLWKNAATLHDSIVKYYTRKDGTDYSQENTTSPAGTIWKIKVYLNNGTILNALARGLCESGVIAKIMNNGDKVCIIQTQDANVLGIRSEQVCAIEFVEEF